MNRAHRTGALLAVAVAVVLGGAAVPAAVAAPADLHLVGHVDVDAGDLAVDPVRNVLYAAEVNGPVQMVDGATRQVVGSFGPIGELGPDALATYPSHDRLFATGLSSGTVYRVDVRQDRIRHTANASTLYFGLAVDTATGLVYAGADHTVVKIGGHSLMPQATFPLPGDEVGVVTDLAVDSRTHTLYVADRDHVYVLDAATGAVRRTVNLTGGADRLAVDPIRGRVYAAGFTAVTVLSSTGDVLGTVSVRTALRDIAVDIGTGRVYTTSGGDEARRGFVTEIDGPAQRVVDQLRLESPPGHLDVDSVTHTVYVAQFPTRLTRAQIAVLHD